MAFPPGTCRHGGRSRIASATAGRTRPWGAPPCLRRRTIPDMQMSNIPFGTTDWTAVARTVHPGETGTATWRTQTFDGIRVRMVEYSPGYLADHWCSKGHILLCLAGELHTELADGRTVVLRPGMSYQVADDAAAHRSRTATGATLF